MASAKILDKNQNKLKLINAVSYAIINVADNTRVTKINEVLPFRVKFTNIGIEGYSKTNPAGIGIAVIGFSNYIL
jgi:hypothetical protein